MRTKLIFLFFFLLNCALILSASTNDITDYEKFASCTCDMTVSMCDPYCCCDSACDDEKIEDWETKNQCSDTKTTYGQLLSYEKCMETASRKQINDLKYSTNYYSVNFWSLFCVYFNNTDSSDLYTSETFKASSDSEFSSLLTSESAPISPYDLLSAPTSTASTSYNPADYLISSTSTDRSSEARFLLPREGSFGECSSAQGTQFLVNQLTHECADYTPAGSCPSNYQSIIKNPMLSIDRDSTNEIEIELLSVLYLDSQGVVKSNQVDELDDFAISVLNGDFCEGVLISVSFFLCFFGFLGLCDGWSFFRRVLKCFFMRISRFRKLECSLFFRMLMLV